ncbi:MAG: hypothetical protein LQ337_008175 [Flavoplaca oasis]|nr:MAG: hypothetical protein LQ337_008175 [Flavoplaca oasis]
MTLRDQRPERGVEMRGRVLEHSSRHSSASDEQTQDIDARRLALLGKKQRLQQVRSAVSANSHQGSRTQE